MPPKLTVSQNVINRLKSVRETSKGNLYGVLHKNTLLIVGVSIYDDPQDSDMINALPTGIDIYGVVISGETKIGEEEVKRITSDVDVTDTPLYMSCVIGTAQNTIETFFNVNNQLEKTSYEVISDKEIYTQFVHIRVMTELPFVSGISPEIIKDSFSNLRKHLINGQVVFNIPNTNVYLMGDECEENGLVGLTGEPTVGEVCKNSLGEGGLKKKKTDLVDMDFLRMVMMKKVTRAASADFKIHTPVVHIDKCFSEMVKVNLKVDTLVVVHKHKKLVALYSILVESCCRFLRHLEGIMVNNVIMCDGDNSSISPLETYHFFPEPCGHFITRTFIKNENAELRAKARRLLHKRLLLPVNQPLFRVGNRFVFEGDAQGAGLLINPHESLNSVKNGGEIVLVKGKYRYYHYCQNNMDDNGWGCAYRSLQTLASWLLLQGYTDTEVPTFHDIQKCLVDIGDKPSSFVGSKQWIGSTEVNFVLNSLLNVTCKILYVSSGEDMASKGPELVYHFKHHGSPIMIGGGVLAHTILGVDYNNLTGEIKFLILDPHYTGSEDLDIILKKGWCGWKGAKFWDKTAYYNMCLPQVPSCV
ncbi:hypothetical protein PPYR_07306 [Photinus pyralis]|uniref:Probable Ufm1-specific protease 2 n=2 Tax=Photinus pyralis TaxID=7054 RepID=A0A5N4AQ54_PHOPY|nr:ufm1-specific protease 2-like [Photinus pyralis]KAB0799426.1 hypothetical protein PPYR_07306 [Photinus pyralis]